MAPASGTAPDLESAGIFEEANREYDKQEYLRAAARSQ